MKAFVIMPYGGKDSNKIREYNRIFRYMIKDAILQYDKSAEVIRQDYTSEGGQIIRNVIKNIAEADVVIADLSEQNWNVAYELGLRHVMSKYGTILVCNDKTELPYDVQQMNIIVYSADSWLDNVEANTDQICAAIASALRHERSDSMVFDVYSALPENLTAMLSSSNDKEQQRIMQLEEELAHTREEAARLKKRVEDAGLDSSQEKETSDILPDFKKAIEDRIYYSDEAVSHLRKLQQENDIDGFAEFLAKVLQDGFLDEDDCINVYIICRRVGIPTITRMYLEIAVGFYPENDLLRTYLADAYSKDYHKRDKAMSMANESLGIQRRDGKYTLLPKRRSERLIRAMLDVYLHLKKYEDLIEIGNLLLDAEPRYSAIIYKNICFAATRLERFEEAKAALDKMLESAPGDDVTYYTAYRYYEAVGDQAEAYRSLETCINKDSSDPDYYFILAGHICDEKLARKKESGAIEPIESYQKEMYAAPFIWRILINDPRATLSRALDFFTKNNFKESLRYMSEISDGSLTFDDIAARFDFWIVDYCLKMVGNI